MKEIVLFLLITTLSAANGMAQSWFNLRNGSDALNANSTIYSICTDTNNNIYAAGNFHDTTRWYVAKWDAATLHWSKLGTGSNGLNANWAINTVCTDKFGNVYAAGSFTNGSTWMVGYPYVAKWDGTHWSELGALNATGLIKSSCADNNGNIYAAGNFYNSSGHYYVAKWNGISWSELGHLNANLFFISICVDDSFNVYAGGNFTDAAGHPYVAKYSPVTNNWTELGTGFDTAGTYGIVINSLFTDTPGHVCAAVNYVHFSSTNSEVFNWNGTSWNQLGVLNGNGEIDAICIGDSGFVYAAGAFKNGAGKNYVAKYDPLTTSWNELGAPTNRFIEHPSKSPAATIFALCTNRNNNVFAAGHFTDSISVTNNYWFVAEYGNAPPSLAIRANDDIKVEIYPNPVNDCFYIKQKEQSAGLKYYFLYNLAGKKELSGLLENGADTKLDLSGIAPGEYILQVNSQSIKIIKQ